MKIFKYEIKVKELQQIEIAGFRKVLKVAEQNENLFIWCVVNDNDKQIDIKTVCVFGTGQELPVYKPNYFDTVITNNGLVWHIYLDN